MDFVAAHPFLTIFWSSMAGYGAACWIYRRSIQRPLELHPEISDTDIEAELRAGHYIEALRLYRRRDGSSLKQAKDAVDAMAQRLGVTH